MEKLFSTILLCLVCTVVIPAQQNHTVIRGKVTDRKGNPLPLANIYISELNTGAASDDNGNYSFTIPSEESRGQTVNITAAYVGYKSQSALIKLNKDTVVQNFSLKIDVFQSDEVVVTGLASKTSKSRAEVSVSRVDAAGLTGTTSFQTIAQLVEGQIAGVQVTSSSGNAGTGFRFYVRGGGGLNGDEQPVVYVDGIRTDADEVTGFPAVGGQGISMLSTLDPENIANIQVLKGPAAAAMYGTSGSNGVVLITTKSGASVLKGSRKLAVNYKFVYGLNTQSFRYKKSDYISADAANAIFKNGGITQNTLSIAGGSEKFTYFGSFDNRIEQGNFPDNALDRKALRINLSSITSPVLNLKVSSAYSSTDISRPMNDVNGWGFLINVLNTPAPYSLTDSSAVFGIKDNSSIESFTGGVQLSLTPLKNLKFYFNGGADISNRRQDQLYPRDLHIPTITNGKRTIFNDNYKQFTYDFNGRYTYNLFNGLQVTSVAGAQLYEQKDKSSWTQSTNFETSLIEDIGAGSNGFYGEGSFNEREAGIFTEHDFSFENQYFLTLGLREDYASSIGSEAPAILYPKVSFALRFDHYRWFPSELFNLFKLRAAYGESGQLPGDLDAVSLLWQANKSDSTIGARIFKIGNPSIKPERIKEIETGLDVEFLNKYSLEFTYYRQNASNSIISKYESPSIGLTEATVPFNIGGVNNWGFESLIKANLIRSKDYELNLSLIWNYQHNIVTSLGGGEPLYDYYNINIIKEGLPKHEFYARKVLGAKFNPDGTYAGVNATSEPVALGNPIPDHTGSFSVNFRFLKNFNLYALMDWALDRKMFNATKLTAAAAGNVPEYNRLEAELNQLTPGTREYIDAANKYAEMDPDYFGNYIEKADYLKIRELSLSFSLKGLLPPPAFDYLNNIIVGVSALNVWTFTGYSGPDVELNTTGSRTLTRGMDAYTLMHPRVYNFWVRISM